MPGEESVEPPDGGAGLAADPELVSINRALRPFHAAQICDLVQAVQTGRSPAVTGRQAIHVQAVVAATYASASTGTPVPVTLGCSSRELEGVS